MAELLGKKKELIETAALQQRVRELTTLHDVARAVTSVLDLQAVLNRIVEASVFLTQAEEGFLLLVDKKTGDLTLSAGKGLGEKAARGMSMKVSDSIAGQVVKTGQPVRIGGFRQDEEYKVKTGYLVKSLVNVPIKSANQVIGVLSVDHSTASMRTFSDHDVALLSSLADYAAIAIENARLYAKASAKADELAAALKEQTGVAPPTAPSPEQDRQALEQFVQGLKAQREEVLRSADSARKLAQNLRSQSEDAEGVAQRLNLWTEDVLGLLPQLEWLAQAGLPQVAKPIDADAPATVSTSDSSSFITHLAEGVLVCDTNGFVRQANKAAAQILGKPVTQLVNSELETVSNDERWQRMVGSLQLALVLGEREKPVPPPLETRLYINNYSIHAKLVPIFDNGTQSASSILAIFNDVSAETEGRRTADRTFANLSQKLRGPMTSIASYSDLLLSDTVSEVGTMQRRYLQRIQQGIERLNSILDELDSDVASTGRQHIPISPYTINEAINQALESAKETLSLEGVSITEDIDDDLPHVHVDAECVSRVLTDLLTVAGKHTKVGDSVSISLHMQGPKDRPSHLIVLIRDGGVTTEDVPPLDEDETIRAAQSLAEDEGGRVWVDRKGDGHGLISFLLPVMKPQ